MRSALPWVSWVLLVRVDRSVAASDWTLTIPLEGPEGANFNIEELDDIEIYFKHRAATRTR